MEIIVYTKEHCNRCDQLKTYLKKKDLLFTEKDINEPETVKELLASDYVVNNFCDENQCIVLTPVVNIDGEWMHKQFFDIKGFNEKRANKIFLK